MCRRQMAGAAVLLEEWLQELAALAQVIYKRLYLHEVFILLFVWQHWPTKICQQANDAIVSIGPGVLQTCP